MQVLFEDVDIRDRGAHEIRQTIDIRVTPEEARRKVNRWLLDSVSYMMHAESPILVINGRSVWRVPASLTATHIGNVGVVGAVDVDVRTGELVDADACRAEMTASALRLAQTLPPYSGPRSVDEQYLPGDIPRAKLLVLPEED